MLIECQAYGINYQINSNGKRLELFVMVTLLNTGWINTRLWERQNGIRARWRQLPEMLFLGFSLWMQHFLGLKTEGISKGNFPLDCSWIREYLWVSYSHLFLINQQPTLWPSGAEYEKKFPEGAHTKTPREFLFPWSYFSSMFPVRIGLIKSW